MLTRPIQTLFSASRSMFAKPLLDNATSVSFARSLFCHAPLLYRQPFVSPYVSGVAISPAFVSNNKEKIDKAKQSLKYNLNCSKSEALSVFLSPTFDFKKYSSEVANIDNLTSNVFSQMFPGLIYEYECLVKKNDNFILNLFLEKKFILALRKVKQTLEDFDVFIDTLFDFKKTFDIIANIDSMTSKVLSQLSPRLFAEYRVVEKDDAARGNFLENTFLPTLRRVFKALAEHYGFDSNLVETSDGVIHDDDYIDFVKRGRLVLDMGEDGHGPLPHILAAFMMKELELQGKIKSALNLYKSLSLRSYNYYCVDRQDYVYYFYLLLDYPVFTGAYMFGNPASMSNHLLFHCDALKNFSSICKMHSQDICKFAAKDWQNSQDKELLSRGRVLKI